MGNIFKQLMNDNSFFIESTGGGCTAYVNRAASIYIVSTCDFVAPVNINQPIRIGIFKNAKIVETYEFKNTNSFLLLQKTILG